MTAYPTVRKTHMRSSSVRKAEPHIRYTPLDSSNSPYLVLFVLARNSQPSPVFAHLFSNFSTLSKRYCRPLSNVFILSSRSLHCLRSFSVSLRLRKYASRTSSNVVFLVLTYIPSTLANNSCPSDHRPLAMTCPQLWQVCRYPPIMLRYRCAYALSPPHDIQRTPCGVMYPI
jgi:hypothetical protein